LNEPLYRQGRGFEMGKIFPKSAEAFEKRIIMSTIVVVISIFLPFCKTAENRISLGYPMEFLTFNFNYLVNMPRRFISIIQFTTFNLFNLLLDVIIVYFALRLLEKVREKTGFHRS
jgi:hypothetical protein